MAQPQWTVENSGTTQNLLSVSFPYSELGWASGMGGTILMSNNGGVNWIPQTSGTTGTLYGISCIDDNTGTASGSSGLILQTDDGGNTWEIVQDGWMITYYTAFQLNSSSAYVGGVNTIFQSFITWTNNNWNSFQNMNFYVIQGGVANECRIRDVFFLNDRLGFAANRVWNGEGAITRTHDGGQSWETIFWADNAFESICFPTDNIGYTVGQSGLVAKTYTGGASWVILPNPANTHLNGVSFVTENWGYVVGDGGFMMMTTDGGTTWELSGGYTAHDLNDIDMVDMEHGYAVGDNGVVLRYGSPFIQDLEISLTPYNPPIVIPGAGGSFEFNIAVTNGGSTAVNADVWTMVTLPTGQFFGPIMNVNVNFPPQNTIDRDRMQVVPPGAPPGQYTYSAYIGDYPFGEIGMDFFTFEKTGQDNSFAGLNGWYECGEDFTETSSPVFPVEYKLHDAYPNPFNPVTNIVFDLPEETFVSLKIYDVQGRQAASLVTGHLSLGEHSVVWNAEEMSSGVYFLQMEARNIVQTQKLLLVK